MDPTALRRAGFARQDGRGRYLLGDEYPRLAPLLAYALPDDAVLLSPRVPTGAVGVSAPAYRTPLSRLTADAARIRATVKEQRCS